MRMKFTRLVSVLIAFAWMTLPLIGQITDNMLNPSLRIGEETADSMACFYASGEWSWSTTNIWNEPVCRITVDDESRPGEFLVKISCANSLSGSVTYIYDAATTQTTYDGSNLLSLTYQLITHYEGEEMPRSEVRRINYTYNGKGQIVSIEERDENDNIHNQDFFYYNEKGDLMSHERVYWNYHYHYETGLPIPETGKVAASDSFVFEFDSQGRKIRMNCYRNNFIYSGEALGKNLQWYYIFYYSDSRIPNAEVENNTSVDSNNQGALDLTINIPVDSVQNGSLVVQLPDGFTLDEANTSLTVDFAGLFDLTITKQESNSWLIEIKPKSLKSAALRAGEIGKMLHIAYKVDDNVQKGTYNISINSILFKTPGDNIIPEPAITVPVNVNRWGVGNEQIEGSGTVVYMTNNTLYIQASQTEQIAIYTINGSKLYEATVSSGTTTIDASAFPQGVLVVKGSSGWVKKVIAP